MIEHADTKTMVQTTSVQSLKHVTSDLFNDLFYDKEIKRDTALLFFESDIKKI
jgi:hypothetical protein